MLDEVTASVKRAYERSRGNTEGTNSDVYPALASVRSDLFEQAWRECHRPAVQCVVGDRARAGRTNPMVNAGAIAATSLAPGATADARLRFIHEGLSGFAGPTLPLNTEVYASASETNFRNQSIAHLLQQSWPDLP